MMFSTLGDNTKAIGAPSGTLFIVVIVYFLDRISALGLLSLARDIFL